MLGWFFCLFVCLTRSAASRTELDGLDDFLMAEVSFDKLIGLLATMQCSQSVLNKLVQEAGPELDSILPLILKSCPFPAITESLSLIDLKQTMLLVSACKIPSHRLVRYLLKTGYQDHLIGAAMTAAAQGGHEAIIDLLNSHPATPVDQLGFALGSIDGRWMRLAKKGRLDIISLESWVHHNRSPYKNEIVLRCFASHGHILLFDYLITLLIYHEVRAISAESFDYCIKHIIEHHYNPSSLMLILKYVSNRQYHVLYEFFAKESLTSGHSYFSALLFARAKYLIFWQVLNTFQLTDLGPQIWLNLLQL